MRESMLDVMSVRWRWPGTAIVMLTSKPDSDEGPTPNIVPAMPLIDMIGHSLGLQVVVTIVSA
jgi:hypothetical protein